MVLERRQRAQPDPVGATVLHYLVFMQVRARLDGLDTASHWVEGASIICWRAGSRGPVPEWVRPAVPGARETCLDPGEVAEGA